MARFRVLLPSMLEAATGGTREVVVHANSLADAIAELRRHEARLYVHLFDENGELRRHVLMFLEGENVRWIQDWSAPQMRDAEIMVIQAVSGG